MIAITPESALVALLTLIVGGEKTYLMVQSLRGKNRNGNGHASAHLQQALVLQEAKAAMREERDAGVEAVSHAINSSHADMMQALRDLIKVNTDTRDATIRLETKITHTNGGGFRW